MKKKQKDIDYALVEDKREPLYTAMKYWGKKPHNIWSSYIENYTPQNGIFLDPFCGSGMSAIESLKLNRKTIAFDLNPLSSFLLKIYTTKFDENKFSQEANNIITSIRKNKIYQKLWNYNGEFHNFKYYDGSIYEICKLDKTIYKQPNVDDLEAIKYAETVDLQSLGINFIDEKFYNITSFPDSFIKGIGGNNFKYIWTKRNLVTLSLIFHSILKVADKSIKEQLLFGFIMIVHLCCKMNIPRNDKSNRNFSTSWGRSAYLTAKKQMEQNPLILFERNCFKKQGVKTALLHSNSYIKKDIKIKEVNNSNKYKQMFPNLKYGVVNALVLSDYIPEKSIDFIMTDPPYGGLVQYLDLSYLWLIWLKHYDKKYGAVDFVGEITINDKNNIKAYEQKFTTSLKEINKVLKDEGKFVITFHNKDIAIWNSFIRSLQNSGFVIEKVIHQKNRRSGESVVANPYGTSGTDFYIRCIKNRNKKFSNIIQYDDLYEKIVDIAISAIANRNEPTPFEILFDAILANITSNGLIFSDDSDKDIKTALNRQLNKIFIIDKNTKGKAGDLWWFKDPKKYIKYPDIPLSERIDKVVYNLLQEHSILKLDDVLAVIYQKFPNGLTPDESNVITSLRKYADKSSNKWVFNSLKDASKEATMHTQYIYKLINIGKILGYGVFVGKREQHEQINNKKLENFADIKEITFIDDNFIKSKISFVDVLYINNENIEYVFEVENSTNIISAIHRSSVLDKSINKIIVIPDNRQIELTEKKEPLFIKAVKENNWKYILYSSLDKLSSSKEPRLELYLEDIVK